MQPLYYYTLEEIFNICKNSENCESCRFAQGENLSCLFHHSSWSGDPKNWSKQNLTSIYYKKKRPTVQIKDLTVRQLMAMCKIIGCSRCSLLDNVTGACKASMLVSGDDDFPPYLWYSEFLGEEIPLDNVDV